MRSTSYPGVCTKPGTYYQGWFMYMRYTQGQNEEYFLSRSVYQTRYLPSNTVQQITAHNMIVTELTQYTLDTHIRIS